MLYCFYHGCCFFLGGGGGGGGGGKVELVLEFIVAMHCIYNMRKYNQIAHGPCTVV